MATALTSLSILTLAQNAVYSEPSALIRAMRTQVVVAISLKLPAIMIFPSACSATAVGATCGSGFRESTVCAPDTTTPLINRTTKPTHCTIFIGDPHIGRWQRLRHIERSTDKPMRAGLAK